MTFQQSIQGVISSDWLITLLLPEGTDRERLMAQMGSQGVETRPVFHCAHTMPMYATGETLSVAESIAARGLSLPSFPTLTDGDILRVVDALTSALSSQGYRRRELTFRYLASSLSRLTETTPTYHNAPTTAFACKSPIEMSPASPWGCRGL